MPTKKIVLSHDPELLAILRTSYFQAEGFDMVLVQDGQTGFQAVEAEAPTLAVFDCAQLGDQALECCRSLKQDPLLAGTPVLLLMPEYADEDLAEAALAVGCDAIVHRPLDAEGVLDAAFRLVGISRRLEPRLPASFQLRFFDPRQKQHLGHCLNLNLGGMFLATETLYPVDTSLRVELTLPGFQDAATIPARVAWVNHPEWLKKRSLPCGMGLEFACSPALKGVLQEVVEGLENGALVE